MDEMKQCRRGKQGGVGRDERTAEMRGMAEMRKTAEMREKKNSGNDGEEIETATTTKGAGGWDEEEEDQARERQDKGETR